MSNEGKKKPATSESKPKKPQKPKKPPTIMIRGSSDLTKGGS